MTNSITSEERLNQIRDRQARCTRPDRDDVPQRTADPLARALSRELRQAQIDRGFLLSLVDSQAGDTVVIDGERRMVIPCPDGRPACEVLHTAPLLDDGVTPRPPTINTGRGRCIHNVPICGECEINRVLVHVSDKERVAASTATAMRDKCVEKVREIGDDWRSEGASEKAYAADYLLTALSSLTLDSVEPQS